jgi:hypothetical protein
MCAWTRLGVRMAEATHATVQTLRRDMSMQAMQQQSFREMFERGFGDIPGFVAGIWMLDRGASETVIVHSFDSLEHAEQFADMARNRADRQAAHGLELVSVRVTEVLGTA